MAISLLAGLANIAGFAKTYLNSNQSKIGEVIIDCAHSEVIDLTNTITDHPVESGASVTDHIYANPLKVRVEGSITDTPISVIGVAKNVVGLFDGNIFDNLKETVLGKGRKQVTAYEMLNDIYKSGSTITLVNYWDTFENMVIESLSFPRDSITGGRLYFEAVLKQITKAEVVTVVIASSTKDVVAKKVNLGSQPAKKVDSAQAAKTSSFLLNKTGKYLGF